MKEYQAARKKLETRRLAYDASLAKMQKAKKEDFRVEEDLRSQKAKYEETSDDVYRRMQDIKESEVDSVADLGAFLDAELVYYDKCREALLQLKNEWPAECANDSSCWVGSVHSPLLAGTLGHRVVVLGQTLGHVLIQHTLLHTDLTQSKKSLLLHLLSPLGLR